jgi:Na+-translocating ferredoxin:NAD+ oxidoreductase RnfC subunit
VSSDLVEKVRQAGVVGAGGAGFPTHVKLEASVEVYIANAAECEPLLCKDQELIKRHAELMVRGLRLAMQCTGARRGVIAIKKKYETAIALLRQQLAAPEAAGAGGEIEFYFYDNFYPAGDEVIIVYDVTGRLIPPAGIPLQVGCAVNNVETLINIARAAEGQAVTHTALTVAGAVRRPISAVVPVGVTAAEVLELAGGSTVDNPALLDGGAMMGRVVFDLGERVTKTSGGYIVLPRDHRLIRRKAQPESVNVRISRSACDQCMYCTELCPRYLLGYAIEPHKVMRSVGFSGETEAQWAQLGLLCCECSVCDLYACPEDLPPKEMCVRSKAIWRQREPKPEPLVGLGRAHPLRDARRVPIGRLIHRLGLGAWDVHAPMTDQSLQPTTVQLLLKQHIGTPAVPRVALGDRVHLGQLLAAPPSGQLGATIHASIEGRVSAIDAHGIWLQR